MTGPASFCASCGAPRPDPTARFCPNCGTAYAGTPASPAPAPVPRQSFSEQYAAKAAASPGTPVPTKGSSGAAEKVVIGLIVLALIGGGYVLWTQQRVGQILSEVGASVTRPTIRPTIEATLEPIASPPISTDEYMAKLKEGVPIVDGDGNDLGTVAVIDAKRYTKVGEYLVVDAGKVWIGARVRYTAAANFGFNMFDWVAHDSAGNQFEPTGYTLDPELGSGTLAKGRKAEGWVAFEVTKGTKNLWVDYTTYDGTIIFSVPLGV